ncbi:NPCBM/NEW2 domain-containing protein [Lentzea flaviverrucosa]|uniref:NPCBM/NEW2 domain-containing protein n=1 Tax=Lentzea flaviverrucosa TaxID=200379 RepID=UPI001FE505C1|nr:NPCBM/NEW2 domain-containing protein [Lentzea flaviverrucosa]
MAALVTLVKQGAELIPVTVVCVAFLAGVAGLLAPPKPVKAAGIILLVGSLIGTAFLFSESAQGTGRNNAAGPTDAAPAVGPSTSQTLTGDRTTPVSESLVPDTTTTTTTTSTAASTRSTGSPRGAGGSYELTAYEPVSFGNGHSSVNSISIGTGPDPFPSSIKGYYSSSASDPNNRRTWLTGGKCTRLTVWVGKDAASSKTGGTGRFAVKAEDVEIASRQATITDAPQQIDVDITSVIRLTLLDTRSGQDANNAWGTPQVQCTSPPGKAK